MSLFAVVQTGVVTEVIEADANPFTPDFALDASAYPEVAPGWLHNDDGTFSAPPPPEVVPPPPPPLDFLGFLALLTTDEQAAVVSSADPRVKVFCLMAAGAPVISLSDTRVAGGINLCASLGLLTSARAKAILSGQAPTS